MANKDLCRSVKIELTTSQEDWVFIRECYVKSFHRYPLYKYMVPDESIRPAFLRAYLDANYEVAVGSGQGILLAIRVLKENQTKSECPEMKVVGGVVFLPPAGEGGGYIINGEELFWNAYIKHGLDKISKEGLERALRYESWEDANIEKKMANAGVPLWSGLFCAIAPSYASSGLGTAVYKEAIRIMAEHTLKIRTNLSKERLSGKNNSKKAVNENEEKLIESRLHRHLLLSHRPLPQPINAKKHSKNCDNLQTPLSQKDRKLDGNASLKGMMHHSSVPLVTAISHSDRAAHFHESNGFHPVLRLPFHDEVEGVTPFYTHVLVLDPFRTGKLEKLTASLTSDEEEKETTATYSLYENLKTAQPDPILVL